jgi:hypothetical protein
VSGHTAVRTLACGTDRFIAWGRCGTWGTAVSLCGGAEDTFLLFASMTTLFIALKAAEFLLDAIYSQQAVRMNRSKGSQEQYRNASLLSNSASPVGLTS